MVDQLAAGREEWWHFLRKPSTVQIVSIKKGGWV
jgi:hypothetical protein